jgi:FtsH-binding integral membrane protein
MLAGWSAFLAGVLLGWWTYVHGTFGYGIAMLVAIVATVLGTASLDLILGRSDQSFVGMALFFTPFSIVAASFGRWVLGRFGVLPLSPGASKSQHS